MNKLNYYRTSLVMVMDRIEQALKAPLCRTKYSDLESRAWTAIDAKDLSKVLSIYHEFRRIEECEVHHG